MARKTFLIMFIFLVLVSIFNYIKPTVESPLGSNLSFDSFPLKFDDWSGSKIYISDDIVGALNPTAIFSADYFNPEGVKVQLLFDYFAASGELSGPHSPRNCMPGAGWTIEQNEERLISMGDNQIKSQRFHIRLDKTRKIMDFWYVTRIGETSNDYILKINLVLSSLTSKPNDIAFIRFITDDDPRSIKALEEFELTVIPEIYDLLEF